jgi:hypothetical protein
MCQSDNAYVVKINSKFCFHLWDDDRKVTVQHSDMQIWTLLPEYLKQRGRLKT